ncbi:MAG TPA: hypothetical protein VMW42_11620 [Desulfatiglandales bacterium]|nr:hypothetical protein [Desulfatiglandales bacterium]
MTLYSTDVKTIRKFGIVSFLFFGALCAVGFWRQKPLPVYLFGFLSALGLGFILLPSYLKPVYVAWLKIAHLLGKIFTTFILALAYYLVITPTALIKRVFGGRPLPISPDKNALSYWVARAEPAQPKERFLKRY